MESVLHEEDYASNSGKDGSKSLVFIGESFIVKGL